MRIETVSGSTLPRLPYNPRMIPLFLGLSIANLILLATVFGLGLFATDAQHKTTGVYSYHISLAFASGMMVLLTHLAFYTYFMATTKWLAAASDKANFPMDRFAAPAYGAKRRAMRVAMTAILLTMLAMFAGAAADPTVRPWWPGEVHMFAAIVAIVANAFCVWIESDMIKSQRRLMDEALAELNAMPGIHVEQT